MSKNSDSVNDVLNVLEEMMNQSFSEGSTKDQRPISEFVEVEDSQVKVLCLELEPGLCKDCVPASSVPAIFAGTRIMEASIDQADARLESGGNLGSDIVERTANVLSAGCVFLPDESIIILMRAMCGLIMQHGILPVGKRRDMTPSSPTS